MPSGFLLDFLEFEGRLVPTGLREQILDSEVQDFVTLNNWYTDSSLQQKVDI